MGFEGICTATVCAMQECALYWQILVATALPCPFQGSAQFRVTVSTPSGFCKGRLYLYSINCPFLGENTIILFPFLRTTLSVYVSLCLCFPSSLFLSLHILVHLAVWWFLFSWFGFCGMEFFWMCVCFLWLFLLFLSLNIFILLFLFSFLISLPPIFSLFLLYVPCSLSIYFSYTFALKRPPKVALLWYSLPGLPWSGTIFSLCSEVCGSNTLSFAYQMGWEPALSIADYLSLEYYASVWSSEKSNTGCCLREW